MGRSIKAEEDIEVSIVPLAPKSDQHLNSSYNITPESWE